MKSSTATKACAVSHSEQIGAAIEQQLDDVDVSLLRRQMQRSAAIVLLLGVNLGAVVNQEANDVDAIEGRSRYQRSLAELFAER